MRIEPYLCLGSVELANDLRTLTYLRRGLGSSKWSVSTRVPLLAGAHCHETVVGDSYSDSYDDTYVGSFATDCDQDAFTPQNLESYCADYDFSTEAASLNYLSPSSDPAPWYSGRSESDDFLGIVLGDTTTHPTLARSLDHGDLGASLGPARAGGQIVAVSGLMVAASRDGMAYGEHWLYGVLAQLCGGTVDMRFQPRCGAWRTLPRVGLVDTPVFGAVDTAPECLVQTVAFQLGSESPWLLTDADVLADQLPLASGASLSYLVETDPWPGDAALRFVVDAGRAGIAGLSIAGTVSPDGSCPASPLRRPCWSFDVDEIPAGHRLIVDGVDHIAQIVNPATNDVIGGLDLLDYTPPFVFPEIASCSKVCVMVNAATAGSGSRISVIRRDREL